MKKNRIIISVLVSFFIILNSTFICFAETSGGGHSRFFGYKDWTLLEKADLWGEVAGTYIVTHYGYIIPGVTFSEKLYSLSNKRYSELRDADSITGTYQEYMASLWEYDESNDTAQITDEGKILAQDFVQETVNKEPFYYAYSLDLDGGNFYSRFQNLSNYKSLVDYIKNNESEYYFCNIASRQYPNKLIAIPKEKLRYFFDANYIVGNSHVKTSFRDVYGSVPWDKFSGNGYDGCKIITFSYGAEFAPVTELDTLGDTNDFRTYMPVYLYFFTEFNESINLSSISDNYNYIISSDSELFKIYKTYDDYASNFLGYDDPYFFKINPIRSDDIITSDDMNKYGNPQVVYNQVLEYISDNSNDYTYDIGKLTNYVVNINGNNNNVGNGNYGSGGSGSNNSESSDGDIFGFLGGIGKIFGSLIKGVGELITNLLSALTEVMTSLTNEVPDSVIGFMGSLMSWVPPDIWILVRLAMVLGLVMAVVKKFF